MRQLLIVILVCTTITAKAQEPKKYDTVKCLVQTVEGEKFKATKAWAVRGYDIVFYQQSSDTMVYDGLTVKLEPVYNRGHIVAFLDSKKKKKLTNIWECEGRMQYVFKNW